MKTITSTNLLMSLIIAFGVVVLHAQTPNAKEWTRQKKTQRKYLYNQIAALQASLEYIKEGYKIVDKGLTLIGDIQNGTLNLDKDFFNSLKNVNPAIRKSPKVNEILVYQQRVINEFKSLINYCKDNVHISPSEDKYINSVYKGMLSKGNDAISELTVITTAGETEMTDDERLSRLDLIHEEMLDQYAFSKDFANKTKLLVMQRAKEKNDIETLRKLHQIPNN